MFRQCSTQNSPISLIIWDLLCVYCEKIDELTLKTSKSRRKKEIVKYYEAQK